MNIVVLQGSPNINGSTAILCNSFKEGALAKGHNVEVINISKLNIKPCIGCVRCGYEGPCSQNDDNKIIKEKLLNSDMVVFATPLYYYGMSAQLKIVIDRFCSYNSSLTYKHLKSALITVAWNSDNWTFDALEAHYKTIVKYLDLNDMGMILGKGCGTPSMTKNSKYMAQAYNLGYNLN